MIVKRNYNISSMFRKLPLITALAFLILSQALLGQETQQSPPGAISLTAYDSIAVSRLPDLKRSSHFLKNSTPELPVSLNNAELPYFRPIFSQGSYASCGQASGVAYNFTYMINRARGLHSDIPENQYPTHYHWNFTNGGYGWYGSSYFHSFEILRTNGSPTIAEYGGMDYGGGMRWMDGYDNYYKGMHNRIEGAYKIDVSTPDGLETLKHWLHNHLDGSETGGVASFYANASHYTFLPPDSPEAGKPVIPSFWGLPSHAWVIVGYNDSIRFDVNQDGQYTNHIDINDDGVVDMRDWEIGGVWVANSYGENWAYKGFTFVLYRNLAESVFSGGIWDNSVHVLRVIENYSPLLTAKIKLKHTSRGMIKVQMGVADNTTLQLPQQIIEFPIFNFQGGNRFMQGGTGEEEKTIEFGLDITPLLDFVTPGSEARFFLQVIENDPMGEHEGEIVAFSIIDYTHSEPVEHAFPSANIRLINHATTTLGITASVDFDPVKIETTELPAMQANETLNSQLAASGGIGPYKWELLYGYTEHFAQYAGPAKSSLKSDTYPGWNQWQSTELDFSFPFFDSSYQEITAYVNGFIMFTEKPYPYPYWLEPAILFRKYECVAPFMARNLKLREENGDQIWFEPFSDHMRVNWKLTYEYGNYQLPVSFSAILYENGNIEYHYGSFSFEDHCIWLGGLSKGDGINHYVSELSGIQEINQNTAVGFTPITVPDNLEITENGWLIYIPENEEVIFDITVSVKDGRSISDRKTFQLSDSFIFEFAPADESLVAGQEASMEVYIKNISSEPVSGINICFHTAGNGLISWLNPCFDPIQLAPGESATLIKPEMFRISENTPDKDLISITGNISFNGQSRSLTRHFNSKKSMLGFTSIMLEGTVQNYYEPGETYTIRAAVANYGDALAENVKLEIISHDPFIILNPPLTFSIGDLPPLGGHEINTTLKIHPKALTGYVSGFRLRLSGDNMVAFETYFRFVIEETKIIIIDLDPLNRSASYIYEAIGQFGLAKDQSNKISPAISDYEVGFLSLGSFPQRHVLTEEDSQILSDFLNSGNRLYVEGSSTWRADPRRPVHDLFGIEGKNQGYSTGIDSLAGYPGSIVEYYAYKYNGTNLRMDNMLPMSNEATILFTDVPSGLHYSISNESGTYKTIGSSFEFGGVYQHPGDDVPVNLIKEYLNFFGLHTEVLVANFVSDKTEICDGDTIEFQLLENAGAQSVLWEFEGGTPQNSSEPNPVVRYDTPGKWPVKLIVLNNNDSDTLVIYDYINVEACAGTPNTDTADFRLYPNPARDVLTIVPQNATPRDVIIRIINTGGKTELEFRKKDFSNSNPALIQTSSLGNGLYIVHITSANSTSGNKLIILK